MAQLLEHLLFFKKTGVLPGQVAHNHPELQCLGIQHNILTSLGAPVYSHRHTDPDRQTDADRYTYTHTCMHAHTLMDTQIKKYFLKSQSILNQCVNLIQC